jgi:hypothetical protein
VARQAGDLEGTGAAATCVADTTPSTTSPQTIAWTL